MTWSCPVCGTVNHDNRRKCTTRDCRHPGGPPSAWDNRRGTRHASPHAHVGVFGQSTMDVSRLFLPELCLARLLLQLQSRRQHGRTLHWWWWQSCKEAASASDFQRFLFGGVRKVARRRLSQLGGDGGPAKAEEQDRLKALDASIANLEKARGGKPDVAIDEVLRQKRLERQELKDQTQSRKSTKALLKAAIAAREKAVIKLEGLQKEEMDLTQLLLLKQQEISDAKSEAAEKAREVETLQARRVAEVDCEGSVSHVSSSAACSAPLSLQQWALGLAASLPEDVRVKFEEWYSSVEIEAKASVDPYSEVLSQGSPATLLPADPVSSTPVVATSTRSAFRAAKAPFPSQRATPNAAGFQVSKSKEQPPGADQFVNAVAQPLLDADV